MFNQLKCVIPARFGSTRFPGKPLADINGKPMIIRVCDLVKDVLPNVEFVVATDDKRISSVVCDAGYEYEITSQKHESGSDRICEVVEKRCWDLNSIILNIQGDEPLIPSDLLKKFKVFIEKKQNFDVWTVTTNFNSIDEVFDVNKVKVLTDKGLKALYFSRLPVPYTRDKCLNSDNLFNYKRHVGIYAYTTAALKNYSNLKKSKYEEMEKLEQLRMLENGFNVGVLHYKGIVPHGVDTLLDLELIKKVTKNK